MVKIKKVNKEYNLNEIFIKSAQAGLIQQKKDGSFAPGHNGPWRDKDTSARVTSHWAIVFTQAYKISKIQEFKKAALLAGNYLLSPSCRPYDFSFHCRDTKNKCNGLIGQAWVMEALLEIGITFNEKKALDVVEEVALQHPFDKKNGLWFNLEIDGKKLNLNRVLNQQVWFCAMVQKIAALAEKHILKERVNRFINQLPKHLDFNQKCISHIICPTFEYQFLNKIWKQTSKTFLPLIFRKANLNQLSREYLSFLLYGLSLLYSQTQSNKTWREHHLQKLVQNNLNYLNEVIYLLKPNPNSYAWAYNPTGFEVTYVINTFNLNSKIGAELWISKQLNSHFNNETNLLNKNTNDPLTLASRIYEVSKLIGPV